MMGGLGSGYRFVRSESAGQAGLTTGLGLPIPVPGGAIFVLTLLSAKGTPIARRFEIWNARAARTGPRDTAKLMDGICACDGPLWDPDNAGRERIATIWAGPIGRIMGTGVPVAETGTAAQGYAMVVALPIHPARRTGPIVVWYR